MILEPAPSDVMAGLDPAIHALTRAYRRDRPIGVIREDETNLPSARPMLQISLPLYRGADIIMTLGVDQKLEAISLGNARDHTLPMFPDAPGEIASNANVEYPVRSVRNDVDPSAVHADSAGMKGMHTATVAWMAGSSPAMTESNPRTQMRWPC